VDELMTYLLLGWVCFCLGVAASPWVRRALGAALGGRGESRLVTTYSYTAPGRMAPRNRGEQWRTWTHRFVLFSEVVGRETGLHPSRLPPVRELSRVSGANKNTFSEYVKVLRDAGVVETGPGGTLWMVGRGARRAALARLPNPPRRPPHFPFWRADTRDTQDTGTPTAPSE
jgi:hypothetical protein